MSEDAKYILCAGAHVVIRDLGNDVYRVDERTPAYVLLSYVEPNEGRRIRETRRRKISALGPCRLATREEIIEQDQHVILMRWRLSKAQNEVKHTEKQIAHLTAALPKQREHAAYLAEQLENLRQVAARKLAGEGEEKA